MLSSIFSKSFIHVIIGVIASTLIVIGVQWDISWHESIGRDTFWTPAHIVIYIGGILGGLGSGFIVIKTTPAIAVNIDIILNCDIFSFNIINESIIIKIAEV